MRECKKTTCIQKFFALFGRINVWLTFCQRYDDAFDKVAFPNQNVAPNVLQFSTRGFYHNDCVTSTQLLVSLSGVSHLDDRVKGVDAERLSEDVFQKKNSIKQKVLTSRDLSPSHVLDRWCMVRGILVFNTIKSHL